MPSTDRKTYKYCILKTPYGFLGLVRTYKGLHSVILPKKTSREIKEVLEKSFKKLINHQKSFIGLKKKLDKYFKGHHVSFRNRLDLDDASDFDRKVYSVVSNIPAGETRSYGWIAKQIGGIKFARAVGKSLSRNKLPIIIPCHRVIGKHYFGGYKPGIKYKQFLLHIEGRLL